MSSNMYEESFGLIPFSYRYFLAVFCATTSCVIILTNVLVIWSLVQTKQLQSTSLKMILLLSTSDLGIGIFVAPLMIVNIAVSKAEDNDMLIAGSVISTVFVHCSAYTIVLIGLDRCAHLKYLNEYQSIVTKRRVYLALSFTTVSSVIISLLRMIGWIYISFDLIAKTISTVFDLVFFLTGLVSYIYMIVLSRRIKKARINSAVAAIIVNPRLSSDQEVVIRYARQIIIAAVLFYAPFMIMSFMYAVLRSNSSVNIPMLEFFNEFVAIIVYINSIANACIFLTVSPKSNKAVTRLFKSFRAQMYRCCRKTTYSVENQDGQHSEQQNTSDGSTQSTAQESVSISQEFSSIIDVDVLPGTVRRVRLCKHLSDKPLGFYIRDGNSTHITAEGIEKVPGIFVSRVVPGGLADSTGLLAVKDEVLEVNGFKVSGKSLDQVTEMMVANTHNLLVTVKSVSNLTTKPTKEIPEPVPQLAHYRDPSLGKSGLISLSDMGIIDLDDDEPVISAIGVVHE